MPIDPSIVLGVKPPRFEQDDPISMFGKVLGAKSALAQGDLQQLQMQQARQAISDEQALRSAYQQSGGDRVRLRELLSTGGQYKALRDLDKFEIDQRKANAAIQKDEAAAAKSKYDVLIDDAKRRASMLTLANPGNWPVIREMIAKESPQAAMAMPEQFDEVWVKSNIAKGQTIAELLTDQRAREQAQENKRANKEREATARGQLAVSQGNLQVSRDRLNFDKTSPKDVLDPERGLLVNPRTGEARPVMMAGQPVGRKPSEAEKKEILSINQQRAVIRGAIDAVKNAPSAFNFKRGLATMGGALSESMAGRYDSTAEREARSYVFNNVSKVINERAGAAQSAQELARLRSFLPAETDNYQQIIDKLHAFEKYLDDLETGTSSMKSQSQRNTPSQQNNSAPKAAGKGVLMQNPDGTFTYGATQ